MAKAKSHSETPTFQFILTGISPILFHADDVDQADRVKAWRDDPDNKKYKIAGDDRSPAWTWSTYLYFGLEHIVWPSDNLMSCLRDAGKKMSTGKGKATFGRLSQSGLLMGEEYCKFEGSAGQVSKLAIEKITSEPFAVQAKMVEKYGFSLFKKRAPVASAKHVRVRPRFDAWRITGTVQITDDQISSDTLEKMFEIAGQRIGLGDWRPSAPSAAGRFGRFRAEIIEI